MSEVPACPVTQASSFLCRYTQARLPYERRWERGKGAGAGSGAGSGSGSGSRDSAVLVE